MTTARELDTVRRAAAVKMLGEAVDSVKQQYGAETSSAIAVTLADKLTVEQLEILSNRLGLSAHMKARETETER